MISHEGYADRIPTGSCPYYCRSLPLTLLTISAKRRLIASLWKLRKNSAIQADDGVASLVIMTQRARPRAPPRHAQEKLASRFRMCSDTQTVECEHGCSELTWPARPPAPWQQGMAPNQAPTRFMAPTLQATAAGRAGRSGNRSSDS